MAYQCFCLVRSVVSTIDQVTAVAAGKGVSRRVGAEAMSARRLSRNMAMVMGWNWELGQSSRKGRSLDG